MTRNYPYFPEQDDERLLDEAIDRLQRGDRSGLDRLDPEMAQTVDTMVGLAKKAGWSRGNVETESSSRPRPARGLPFLRSLAAAAIVLILVGSLGVLGWRVAESEFRDEPEQTQPTLAPLVPTEEASRTEGTSAADAASLCVREARSPAEIERIASTQGASGAGGPYDTSSFVAIEDKLAQLTREWNACMAEGSFDRAMAYESEGFIRAMADSGGRPEGDDMAMALARKHGSLEPMAHGACIEIVIYVTNWFRAPVVSGAGTSEGDGSFKIETIHDGPDEASTYITVRGMGSAELQMVPVDANGDWVQWPTVFTFVYEDGQWVIDHVDITGSPSTPVPETGR